MTKAQTRASNKYNSKAYDRIAIQVKKGERDRYKALAARLSLSVNQLFVQAVEQFIADNIGTLDDSAAATEKSDK